MPGTASAPGVHPADYASKLTPTATDLLLLLGIVGAGLLSGLYFIFSFCVMWSLNKQAPATAIVIMNTINEVIINPAFMSVFFGTPLVCAALLFCTCWDGVWKADDVYMATGAAVTLTGEFLVTLTMNVPKNDALAAYELGSGDDAVEWSNYYASWTAWNTVRMTASIISVLLFSWALHLKGIRGVFAFKELSVAINDGRQ
eukprot:TRINITY_DN109148_c0_g1_i1.p1 TRINITY_DN109148_c0_g1~~TRINITY_DN109148_c0_g1_i1.p1  ORF type:complete len:201 (+),score=27.00 TRINITY_DN109148_c0_g1_i1:56-658(+)